MWLQAVASTVAYPHELIRYDCTWSQAYSLSTAVSPCLALWWCIRQILLCRSQMHVAGLGPIRGLKEITLRIYREQGIKGLYAGKRLEVSP